VLYLSTDSRIQPVVGEGRMNMENALFKTEVANAKRKRHRGMKRR
jgi:hypothetical protein